MAGGERPLGRPLAPLLQEIAALRPDGRLDLGDSSAFIDAWLDSAPNALGARSRDRLFRTARGPD